MAYCQNCGAEMNDNANFCPNCGTAANGTTSQNTNISHTDTAKTVLTAAGTAAGITLLGSALHRRRRRHMMPPHGGMMCGPRMHGHGPGGRGPGRGRRGGMGGPGGRW